MCDKRVSTNRLVNITEPVFNRLPSTDKYDLRNARQVNRVLGLHQLDYVANCLPSTVVMFVTEVNSSEKSFMFGKKPSITILFANFTIGMENMSPKDM